MHILGARQWGKWNKNERKMTFRNHITLGTCYSCLCWRLGPESITDGWQAEPLIRDGVQWEVLRSLRKCPGRELWNPSFFCSVFLFPGHEIIPFFLSILISLCPVSNSKQPLDFGPKLPRQGVQVSLFWFISWLSLLFCYNDIKLTNEEFYTDPEKISFFFYVYLRNIFKSNVSF